MKFVTVIVIVRVQKDKKNMKLRVYINQHRTTSRYRIFIIPPV